jgi:hypothetical protein
VIRDIEPLERGSGSADFHGLMAGKSGFGSNGARGVERFSGAGRQPIASDMVDWRTVGGERTVRGG